MKLVVVSTLSSPELTQKVEYSVWMIGKKMRYDMTVRESSRQEEVNQRRYFCRHCEMQGYALHGMVGDNTYTAVSFADMTKSPSGVQFDLDWSAFALYPGFIQDLRLPDPICLRRYQSLVTNPDGHDITVSQRTPETKAIKIRYKSGSELELIVDTRHYRPVSVEMRGKNEYLEAYSMTYDDSLSTRYPKRMECKLSNRSGVVKNESIEVSSVSVNEPVEDSVFTVAGLNLKDGTPIKYPSIKSSSNYPTWRNGHVDKEYTTGKVANEVYRKLEATTATPDTPAPSFWSRSWPYLVGAAVLALVGFFLLRKMRHQPA